MATAWAIDNLAEPSPPQSDPKADLLRLRRFCRAPGFHEDTAELTRAMKELALIAPRLGDSKLRITAAAVADAPYDVEALRALGWTLGDRGLFDLASAVLSRANGLAPGSASILTELAVALEADGRSDRAVAALESEPGVLASSFLCRHLLARSAVMIRQLSHARALAYAQLPSDEIEERMAHRVHQMIDRADAALDAEGLDDDDDLRGWHFVITGVLLLHLSPVGYDNGLQGRYGFMIDSYERIHHCLLRLRPALGGLGFHPDRVMVPDDPSSIGLGMAAARMLRLPLARLDDGPGLIVVHDAARLHDDVVQRLAHRSPGQVLYAHATCWAEPSIAPDLTGVLYQGNIAPWDTRTRRFELTASPSRRGAVSALPGEVADRVMMAPGCRAHPHAPHDSDDDVLALCLAARSIFAFDDLDERTWMPRTGGAADSDVL